MKINDIERVKEIISFILLSEEQFWLHKTVHKKSLDIFINLWVYPMTAVNLLSLTFKQRFYFTPSLQCKDISMKSTNITGLIFPL